jgi:hypothetical protein
MSPLPAKTGLACLGESFRQARLEVEQVIFANYPLELSQLSAGSIKRRNLLVWPSELPTKLLKLWGHGAPLLPTEDAKPTFCSAKLGALILQLKLHPGRRSYSTNISSRNTVPDYLGVFCRRKLSPICSQITSFSGEI